MNTTSLATILVMFGVPFAAGRAAADWPQFRGPTGQGVSTAKNVPLEWGPTSNVAWKVPLEGTGWSSPVLARGRVYLTAAVAAGDTEPQNDDSSAVSLRAICLDAADGKVVWDVEAIAATADKAKPLHSKNSLASPTPVVDADRLFVHFGHMGTAALDLDGKVLWRQTGVDYAPVHGNGGSPIIVDNLLVFSCDGAEDPFLVALDRTTGEIRWKTPRESDAKKNFSFSTPLVVEVQGQRQIVSPASGLVAAYNPRDGREQWRVRYGDGYSVIPRPVISHGMLLLSSGFDRPAMYAIRLPGGRDSSMLADLTQTHVAWRHDKVAPNTPSPITNGDNLFFVSDRGVASCLDVQSGEVRWSERLGGAFSASPVGAEGRIYFLSEQGVCHVVAADAEFKLLATNELGERTLASPAVSDGALFLRSESHLWRIGSPPK